MISDILPRCEPLGHHSMSHNIASSGDQERYNRRLSDKIQTAFDHACDEGELAVASDLLVTLELVLLRVAPRPDRREAIVASLMTSHERLWHLRSMAGEAPPGAPTPPDGAANGSTPPVEV
jgi:hypothetical protein